MISNPFETSEAKVLFLKLEFLKGDIQMAPPLRSNRELFYTLANRKKSHGRK